MSHPNRVLRHLAFTVPILAIPAVGLGSTPHFEGLGDFPGGSFSSKAFAVSADGHVVVGWSEDSSGYRAFRWETGVMSDLGDDLSGGSVSRAHFVSGDGSVVVGIRNAHIDSVNGTFTDGEAFRWTEVDGMTGLNDLSGDTVVSEGWGITSDGTFIVGRRRTLVGSEAFYWTESEGMVPLPDLPGGSNASFARSVSGDGMVIVGYGASTASGPHQEAGRWTFDGSSWNAGGLGDLLGGVFNSWAWNASDDGSVIVGQGTSAGSASGNPNEAFRWEGGTITGLGDLAGGLHDSVAYGVSADGSVVVGRGYSDLGAEAFIWDVVNGVQKLRDLLVDGPCLDLTGWILSEARGISADGLTIVGTGINPQGNEEAWIAHLGQPSAAVLTSAVSRKTHENVGDFDIELPLGGEAAIECRLGGPTKVILKFDQPVTGDGGNLTCGNVSVDGAFGCQSVLGSGSNELTVNLVGVTNNACLSLTLVGITAACGGLPLTGDNDVYIQVRRGDVDGDNFVGLSDLAGIKAELFQPVTSGNFRLDVDHDGFIGLEDLASTKANLFQGTGILCAP